MSENNELAMPSDRNLLADAWKIIDTGRQLAFSRQFYRRYSIAHTLCAQLDWSSISF